MTFNNLIFVLILLAALGCGLVAGIFFAFSAFVMKALSRLPPHEGIAAMQSIDIVIINPYFFTAFFGTAAICLLAIIYALFRWQEPAAAYLLVGGAVYLVGCIMVTMFFNVPLNNSLASAVPTASDSAAFWESYVSNWTMWNTVRTIASLASAALFTIALKF